MKLMVYFLVTVFLALNIEGAERVSAPPGKVYTYKEGDGVKRELEVYFPEGHDASAEPVPAIIFFHGGGWGGGSREAFSYQCDYFASRGIAAVTVTYRLATREEKNKMTGDHSPKRLCIPDAKSAIRWVKQNAKELGVNPNRLIAGGGSAGGHICLIATSNPGLNDPGDPEGFDTLVAARVLFNPALAAKDASDPEIDFAQHLKPGAPPSIAFFGSEDKWLTEWNRVSEQWKALDDTSVELEIAKGQGHAFFNRQPWADLTLISADKFLVRHGFLKGVPTLPVPDNGAKMEPVKD